ncbi:MAG TPA: hypothetical protein VH815_08705 [Acidobacteriota bacterium]|jgi:hypothetical protein
MKNIAKIVADSSMDNMALYKFDVEINDDDIIKVAAFNTYLELSQGNETLINMGLKKNDRIVVSVMIEILHAKDK